MRLTTLLIAVLLLSTRLGYAEINLSPFAKPKAKAETKVEPKAEPKVEPVDLDKLKAQVRAEIEAEAKAKVDAAEAEAEAKAKARAEREEERAELVASLVRALKSMRGVAKVADDPQPVPVPPPQPGPMPQPVPPQPQPAPPDPHPAILPVLAVANYVGDVGQHILVRADTNCSNVKFFVIDQKGLSLIPPDGITTAPVPDAIVVQASAPGQYRMLAYASLNDITTNPVLFTITVTGLAPQPPPAPQPQPQPQPQPLPPAPAPQPAPVTAAKLWIVTVDDVSARTEVTAAVLGDVILWAQDGRAGSLKAQGHQWVKLNVTDPQVPNFDKMLKLNGGIPCVVILDAMTKKWLNQSASDTRLPNTVAGMQALINKYSGK